MPRRSEYTYLLGGVGIGVIARNATTSFGNHRAAQDEFLLAQRNRIVARTLGIRK